MGKTVRTATLEIGYQESGPADGPAVILLHGFPDDVHAYGGVVPKLAADGCRVLVPWLRGYGPTRFLDPATPRSGQCAIKETENARNAKLWPLRRDPL